MLICDELKEDVRGAVLQYIQKNTLVRPMTILRQKQIRKIYALLSGSDPVKISQKLRSYLDGLGNPFFHWVRLIDAHHFVGLVKDVLDQEKYQEVALLKKQLVEKNQIIVALKLKESGLPEKQRAQDTEKRLSEIADELRLLRSENKYLYTTVASMDKKIQDLEREAKYRPEIISMSEEPSQPSRVTDDKMGSSKCLSEGARSSYNPFDFPRNFEQPKI